MKITKLLLGLVVLGMVSFVAIKYINDPNFRLDTRGKAYEQDNLVKSKLEPKRKFAFANHPRRDLSSDEITYLANNYDLVVVGNQTKVSQADAKAIKDINPKVVVLEYFPTTIRHDAANYGTSDFRDSWYLFDKSNTKIIKGQGGVMHYIDLSNNEYVSWATRTIRNFLSSNSFDGLLMDNANPILHLEGKVDDTKIAKYNTEQTSYLKNLSSIAKSKGGMVIFNGLARTIYKENRSLNHIDNTDGAINEEFCFGDQDGNSPGIFSKELQLEDIELQKKLGKAGKIVLQKVNITPDLLSRYEKFCYGVYLMGEVENMTYYKYGMGYNLLLFPNEYKLSETESEIILGRPSGDYRKNDWVLSRQFQNYWVAVNLDTSATKWRHPVTNQEISIPGREALFIEKEAINKNCAEYCKTNQHPKGGWCAFASKNCSQTGVNVSAADKQCPSYRPACCCKN